MRKIYALSMIAFAGLFCGCTDHGNSGCSDPYVMIGNACCVDGDANGVCDRDEAPATTKVDATTTKHATTTAPSSTASPTPTTAATLPDTAVTSTSASDRTTTTFNTCRTASDCGYPYTGGCTCQGDGVTRTVYKPVCSAGTCIWKGEAVIDRCRDGSGNTEKEHCVSGYANCISDDDYQEYIVMPEDAEVLTGLSAEYTAGYDDYRFRIRDIQFPEDSRCYDDARILLDVMKPGGKEAAVEIRWNKHGEIDDLEIGLKDFRRGGNGSVTPTLWVMED